MLEIAEDANSSANFLYGLLISKIMIEAQVDTSRFQATESLLPMTTQHSQVWDTP